jgi:outer membrane protein assembly factor BamB
MRAQRSNIPRGGLHRAAVVLTLMAALSLPAYTADWLTFHHGVERHNYTAEKFTWPLSLVWKFTSEPSDDRVPPVVTGDHVFAAAGTHMYGLQRATGSTIWDYDAKDTILGAPTYADGRIVFGCDSGKAICLNADDGKELWTVTTARPIRAAPAVAGGTVFIASLDRRVIAVDAATGAEKWTRQLTDELWGAPAVLGSLVFVPTADAQVFALDVGDGRIRQQLTMPQRRAIMHPVVISEDAMYVAGRSDLHALSRRGTERWSLDWGVFLTGAPAVYGDRVFVSLIDGRMFALDAEKGRTLWEFDFNAAMASPPTAAGDVVIAGAAGGLVYAVDAATGEPRWRYAARPPGIAAGSTADFNLVAPAVYANDSLYLIWNSGDLARFDVNAPDVVPPTIRLLTPSENTVTGTKLPKLIGAQVFDEESGIDVYSLKMTMDGQPVDAKYDPYTGYYSYSIDDKSPFAPLKAGWHTMSVTARDQRGNEETKTWRFVAQPGAEAWEKQQQQQAPAQPAQPTPAQPGQPPGAAPQPTEPGVLPGGPSVAPPPAL